MSAGCHLNGCELAGTEPSGLCDQHVQMFYPLGAVATMGKIYRPPAEHSQEPNKKEECRLPGCTAPAGSGGVFCDGHNPYRSQPPKPDMVNEPPHYKAGLPHAEAELAQMLERRRVYIEYARHRIDDEDWHGCSDAANDLRELDVEIRMHRDRYGL